MKPVTLVCIRWAVAFVTHALIVGACVAGLYFVVRVLMDVGLREIAMILWCGSAGC